MATSTASRARVSRRFWTAWLLATAVASALGACSSSAPEDSGAGPSDAATVRDDAALDAGADAFDGPYLFKPCELVDAAPVDAGDGEAGEPFCGEWECMPIAYDGATVTQCSHTCELPYGAACSDQGGTCRCASPDACAPYTVSVCASSP